MPPNPFAPREPITDLIGREQDVARLESSLRSGHRLVTILGPSGIGKTRLAQNIAARWSKRTADRVGFCHASDAADEDEALLLLGRAGGLPPDDGSETALAYAARIPHAPRPFLVFDGIERLSLSRALADLLAGHPTLVLLVTSQRRLDVAGEHVVELEPLEETAAVSLFLERAAAHSGNFPDGQDASDIARSIVLKLECIPFAIELAAAQTVILTPEELLDRLRSPTGGTPEPGSSLRRAVRSMFESIPAGVRECLEQASVFESAFDLAMAEASIAVPSDTTVVRALMSLRDHSLLRILGGGEKRRRFALYRTVRDALREWTGDQSNVWEARARKYRYLVHRISELDQTDEDSRIRELEELSSELVVLADTEPDLASTRVDHRDRLIAATALADLARVRGPITRALARLNRLLTSSPDPQSRTTAWARIARMRLHLRGGSIDDIQSELRSSDLVEATENGGDSITVELGVLHAEVARACGDLDEARNHLARIAPAAAKAGTAATARVESQLAVVELEAHRIDEAARAFGRAIAAHTQAKNRRGEAIDRSNLAVLEHARGNLEIARSGAAAALDRHREVGNDRFVGIGLFDLARIDFEEGAVSAAIAGLNEAIPLLEMTDEANALALALATRGACFAYRGEPEFARDDETTAARTTAVANSVHTRTTTESHERSPTRSRSPSAHRGGATRGGERPP